MPTNPCPPSKKDRPHQPWRTKAIRNMQKKGWLISKTKPQRPKLRVERLTPEVPVLGGTWPKCNCRLNRWSWQMGVSGDPKDLSLVFQNSLKIFNLKEKHSISQTYPKQNQAADGCSRNSQAVSCCMWRTRHFLFSMGSCEHQVTIGDSFVATIHLAFWTLFPEGSLLSSRPFSCESKQKIHTKKSQRLTSVGV